MIRSFSPMVALSRISRESKFLDTAQVMTGLQPGRQYFYRFGCRSASKGWEQAHSSFTGDPTVIGGTDHTWAAGEPQTPQTPPARFLPQREMPSNATDLKLEIHVLITAGVMMSEEHSSYTT